MPIVTINQNANSRLAAVIQTLGASALNTTPDNIWVLFQPRAEMLPPIVSIQAKSGRSIAERHAFVNVVATAVGKEMSIPAEKVWIHYQEINPKDIWFEGSWGK